MMNESQWNQVRDEVLLDPSLAYFCANSFSPLSLTVFERITALRLELAINPSDFMLRQVPDLLWQARLALTEYLSGLPNRLIFTTNASSALSVITSSLKFEDGGEILLTDHEYLTATWNWQRFAEKWRMTIRVLELPCEPVEAEEVVQLAAAAISNNTKLFFFSHVLSTVGTVLPAEKLCKLAQERGIVSVVDGSQAIGQIPVCLSDIDCDFYIGSGHKWLMTPTGCGFIYLGKVKEERLEPLILSWGYRHSNKQLDEKDSFGSTPRLRRIECEGTKDITPWLVVPEAIQFRKRLGHVETFDRIKFLATLMKEQILKNTKLSLATPGSIDLYAGMIAFWLPRHLDVESLKQELWQDYGVEVSLSSYQERPLLRLATHVFNTPQEIDLVVGALQKLLEFKQA